MDGGASEATQSVNFKARCGAQVRSLKADQLIAGQQVVGGITSQPTGQRFWMASLRKPGGKLGIFRE